MRRRILTVDQTDEIVRLYTEVGLSLSQVAARCHISRSTATRHLKSRGIELRKRGTRPGTIRSEVHQPDLEAMDFYYHGLGMSLREVGERFGHSEGKTRDIFERYGIPRRSASDAMRKRWQAHPITEEERERRRQVGRERWQKGYRFGRSNDTEQDPAVA